MPKLPNLYTSIEYKVYKFTKQAVSQCFQWFEAVNVL